MCWCRCRQVEKEHVSVCRSWPLKSQRVCVGVSGINGERKRERKSIEEMERS